jgi:hypothetical protein
MAALPIRNVRRFVAWNFIEFLPWNYMSGRAAATATERWPAAIMTGMRQDFNKPLVCNAFFVNFCTHLAYFV